MDVTRHEVKYDIDISAAAALRYRLSPILQLDPHCRSNGYLVRSLYFDTPDSLDYFDKVAGLESRKKVRLRVYSFGDSPAKLELKQKQANLQRKRSLTVTRAEAESIIAGDLSCLDDHGEFGQYMARLMGTGLYRPCCMIEYDRTAYLSPTNDTRITIDSNLRSNEGNFALYDPGIQFSPISPLGMSTLEVKYNHFLLSYIKDAVSPADKLSISSSKYCRCRQFGLKGE